MGGLGTSRRGAAGWRREVGKDINDHKMHMRAHGKAFALDTMPRLCGLLI